MRSASYSSSASPCWAFATACSWPANHWAERSPSTPRASMDALACRVLADSPLFEGVARETDVWMSHGDQVSASLRRIPAAGGHRYLPDRRRAASAAARLRPAVPSGSHAYAGWVARILRNFLLQVCGCEGTGRWGTSREQAIQSIRQRVGADRVICGFSGGVDSAVTAALLYQAIGPQLSCILVDNGLLRKDEAGTGD